MREKRAKWGLIFCLPFLLIFTIFSLYPIVYSFYLSLTMQISSKQFEFVGLENYAYLLRDKLFWKSVGNTWIIWLICFIPQLITALIISILLTQYRVRGAAVFRAIFYLPNLITAASIGSLFLALFDWQTGSVNSFLLHAGWVREKIHWMASPIFAQSLVGFLQWFMWFGYSSILFTAGITAIPQDIIDASVVDGANSWNRLTRITLPLLKSTILYVLVTSLIGGMQIFDLPMTLTAGNGEPKKSLMTMVLYLYNMSFKNNDLPYGATISYGIFVIIMIFSLIFFKAVYGRKGNEG
jgi:ABC-type sugar transport system permease subunit